MSRAVRLVVSFDCADNNQVSALAWRHLNTPSFRADASQEAMQFLRDLIERSGGNPGTKGGMSVWSIVNNYTVPSRFVTDLTLFWKDLLQNKFGSPWSFSRVMVFSEIEGDGYASAIEIYWDDPDIKRELVFKNHAMLPFTWG